MKSEDWGNCGAVEIQGLTASKLLPQLPQDAFLLGGRYAETPQKRMPDFQMSPVVLRLALKAGGADLTRFMLPLHCILPFDTPCLFLGLFRSKSVPEAQDQKWSKGPSVLMIPRASKWGKNLLPDFQSSALPTELPSQNHCPTHTRCTFAVFRLTACILFCA